MFNVECEALPLCSTNSSQPSDQSLTNSTDYVKQWQPTPKRTPLLSMKVQATLYNQQVGVFCVQLRSKKRHIKRISYLVNSNTK